MTLKAVVTELRTWLNNHANINEVTLGDVSEVDLSTMTNFPIAHLIPISTIHLSGISTHTFQMLFLSTFEPSIEDKIDVLSSMNLVVSDFVNSLENGLLFDVAEISLSPSSEVMYDQFANRLYGYSISVSITVERDLSC